THTIAYWDVFGRPKTKPTYAPGYPETWWRGGPKPRRGRGARAWAWTGGQLVAGGASARAISSITEHPLVVLAAVLGGLIVFGVLAAIPTLSWLEPYLLTTGWSAGVDVLRDPLPFDGLRESTLRALCYLAVGGGVTVARMLSRDA
ncbi:MAG: hypothetical protein L0H84_15325, partial [Pseudonocardia sp.]|nr:hypothetical protein [Pseudonocardia sp.]